MRYILLLYVRLCFFIHDFFSKKKKVDINKTKINVIYRISDVGYKKEKPNWINNENCLRNAAKLFPIKMCNWIIIADNVSEKTYDMILRFFPKEVIRRVSVGNGAGTFRLAYEEALRLNDDEIVYFLENDYIHREGAFSVLMEGLLMGKGEYVTLYDNLDKYEYQGLNPFVAGGEKTIVYLTSSTHWKITNSTTMTFASHVRTLKKDKKIFWRWTQTSHPCDFHIFVNLHLKGRILLCPMPGYSTHGDCKYISPIIDWEKIANK